MKPDAQSNKIKHNVNIKENIHNSIYIGIYNNKIQDVPIILCFNCGRLVFKNNLKVFQINCQNNILHILKFK